MVRPPKRQGAPPPHRPLFYAGQVPEGTEHLSWRTPVPNLVLADAPAAVRRRSRRVDSTENSCVSGVPELALDLIALTIYR